MLSISAYGQTGPNRERAGFGTLAEAISGYAYVTGQADGPPTLPSFALADSICGLCGAYAVMVALHERDTVSGLGQHIDLALYEPLMLMMGHYYLDFDQLGKVGQRNGSRLPFASPRNAYSTADGRWVAMSCSSQSVFERSCRAIDRPELIDDPRFVDNAARIEHADEIDDIFVEWIGRHDADHVLATLNDAGAAAAPIYDMREIFADPHFAARENIAAVPDDELGVIRMQNLAPKLSRSPGQIRHAGPRLGEHTTEVLMDWLRIDADEAERLHAAAVPDE
jgi:crotonobetainyl-CoA:carnitine CoA-transferase CaiB-like acyl-CoA transferase